MTGTGVSLTPDYRDKGESNNYWQIRQDGGINQNGWRTNRNTCDKLTLVYKNIMLETSPSDEQVQEGATLWWNYILNS